MSLGLSPSSWAEVVATAPDALCAESSVKNAEHILSKAVTRGPQKILAELVASHFETTISDANGRRLIELVVRFGTVRSVKQICSLLNQHNVIKEEKIAPVDVAPMLRAICERVDDEGEERKQVLEQIAAKGPVALLTEPAIQYAAELLVASDAALSKFVGSKPAKTSLAALLTQKQRPKYAIHFVEVLLSKCHAEKRDNVSKIVTDALKDLLKQGAPHHPREELMLIICQHGSEASIQAITESAISWDHKSVLTNQEMAKLITLMLDRAPEESGAKLATALMNSIGVKALANSKTAAVLGVADAIRRRFGSQIPSGEDSAAKAAQFRFQRATMPRFAATKMNILEKIKMSSSSADSRKRSRS